MPQECGRLEVGKRVHFVTVSIGFRAVNFEEKPKDEQAVFVDVDLDIIRIHEDAKALQSSVLVCLCTDASNAVDFSHDPSWLIFVLGRNHAMRFASCDWLFLQLATCVVDALVSHASIDLLEQLPVEVYLLPGFDLLAVVVSLFRLTCEQ